MTDKSKYKNVILLKLTNGDEVFGEVVFRDENKTVVKSPMILVSKAMNDGTTATIFNHYLTFCKSDEYEFSNKLIITSNFVIDELSEYYEQSVKYNKQFDAQLVENVKNALSSIKKYLSSDQSLKKDDISDEDMKKELYKMFLNSLDESSEKPN